MLRTLRRAREKNLQILELKQIDEREIDDDMGWDFNMEIAKNQNLIHNFLPKTYPKIKTNHNFS